MGSIVAIFLFYRCCLQTFLGIYSILKQTKVPTKKRSWRLWPFLTTKDLSINSCVELVQRLERMSKIKIWSINCWGEAQDLVERLERLLQAVQREKVGQCMGGTFGGGGGGG